MAYKLELLYSLHGEILEKFALTIGEGYAGLAQGGRACKKLGVTDNLCGKCEADGKGWKLTNMEAGLRWGGKSFDDNQNGKGTLQAPNICALAAYGNKVAPPAPLPPRSARAAVNAPPALCALASVCV